MNNLEDSSYQFVDPYELTPDEVIEAKLRLLELKDDDILVDLGCGNAQSLIVARKFKDINCIGYEVLPKALKAAYKNIEAENMSDHIEIRETNLYEANVSNTTALILYLTRFTLGHLSIKLENELPVGARIVTHDFNIPGWEPEKIIRYRSKNSVPYMLYLYQKK